MEQNLMRQMAIDLIEKLKDPTYIPNPVERDMITQCLQKALDDGEKQQPNEKKSNRRKINEGMIVIEYYTLKKQQQQGKTIVKDIVYHLTQKYAISEEKLNKLIYDKGGKLIKPAVLMTNEQQQAHFKKLSVSRKGKKV